MVARTLSSAWIAFSAIACLALGATFTSGAQQSQTPDPAKWMCRDLAESGGFIYQGESVFGKQACRPIPEAPTQPKQAASSKPNCGAATDSSSGAAARFRDGSDLSAGPNDRFDAKGKYLYRWQAPLRPFKQFILSV